MVILWCLSALRARIALSPTLSWTNVVCNSLWYTQRLIMTDEALNSNYCLNVISKIITFNFQELLQPWHTLEDSLHLPQYFFDLLFFQHLFIQRWTYASPIYLHSAHLCHRTIFSTDANSSRPFQLSQFVTDSSDFGRYVKIPCFAGIRNS